MPTPPCQGATTETTFYHAAKSVFPAELFTFAVYVKAAGLCTPPQNFLCSFKDFFRNNGLVVLTNIKLIFLAEIVQTTCKELRPLVQEYQRAADKKQFRRKHEGTLILYEAATKALKEQGFQKLPDLYALKAEYKQLTEQKDQLQRRYSEAKRRMQEYGIIKQNVDGILRTTPGKEQMQER